MQIADVRARLRPVLLPLKPVLAQFGRWRRRLLYIRYGIEGICMELRRTVDCVDILREYGAKVGPNSTVFGPLHIANADRDFSRLTIGRDVYIGTDCLIDLADDVTIGDDVALAYRISLITTFDVGTGPLKARRPHKQGPIVLEDGCYLGTGVTILHGVTVGAEATVGAYCLIRRDVPPGTTWVSPAGQASQLPNQPRQAQGGDRPG